jgi:hypothetical protein
MLHEASTAWESANPTHGADVLHVSHDGLPFTSGRLLPFHDNSFIVDIFEVGNAKLLRPQGRDLGAGPREPFLYELLLLIDLLLSRQGDTGRVDEDCWCES